MSTRRGKDVLIGQLYYRAKKGTTSKKVSLAREEPTAN
jgi:hypothetical protein